MARRQELTHDPALLQEVARALETTADLLPHMPALLQDLPDLSGCTAIVVEVLRRLGVKRAAKALDLGCGRGELALALARDLGLQVLGIDAFAPFIAHARAAAWRSGLACRFEVGDLRKALNSRVEPVDVVLLVSVGPIFGDHASTQGALRRVVRPGGLVVIADAYLEGQAPPGEFWTGYGDRTTTERHLTMQGDRLILTQPLRDRLRHWNSNAMSAIVARAREIELTFPELGRSLDDYLCGQRATFAQLETGPVVPVLWVLERAG